MTDLNGRIASLDRRFGEIARDARKRHGWSQLALADELRKNYQLDLDNSAITRIENGSRALRFGEALAIADCLQMNIAEFFDSSSIESAMARVVVNQARRALTEALGTLDDLALGAGLAEYRRGESVSSDWLAVPEAPLRRIKALLQRSVRALNEATSDGSTVGRNYWKGTHDTLRQVLLDLGLSHIEIAAVEEDSCPARQAQRRAFDELRKLDEEIGLEP